MLSRNLKLNIGALKQGWDYAGDYIAQASFLCARGWALSNDKRHAAKIMAKYLTQVLFTGFVELVSGVILCITYIPRECMKDGGGGGGGGGHVLMASGENGLLLF